MIVLRLGVFASALVAGSLVGGCENEEPALKCGAGQKAVSICCVPPDGEGDDSCYDACRPTCESDADCSEETCQGGVCGPDDDCSI